MNIRKQENENMRTWKIETTRKLNNEKYKYENEKQSKCGNLWNWENEKMRQ